MVENKSNISSLLESCEVFQCCPFVAPHTCLDSFFCSLCTIWPPDSSWQSCPKKNTSALRSGPGLAQYHDVGQHLKSISTCIHVWSIWFELSWFWPGFEPSLAWRHSVCLTIRRSNLNTLMSNGLLLENAFRDRFPMTRRYKIRIWQK